MKSTLFGPALMAAALVAGAGLAHAADKPPPWRAAMTTLPSACATRYWCIRATPCGTISAIA